MKPLKRQYQIFVREMNKHGDYTKAYQKAYPKAKVTSARVKGYTLLQNVTIAEKIKQQSDKIEQIATKEATERLQNEIVYDVLTASRKKELLRLISEGKMMHKVLKPIWNDISNLFLIEINAIPLLNNLVFEYETTPCLL